MTKKLKAKKNDKGWEFGIISESSGQVIKSSYINISTEEAKRLAETINTKTNEKEIKRHAL